MKIMIMKKIGIMMLLSIILLVPVFAHGHEDFEIVNPAYNVNYSLEYVSNGLSNVTPDVNDNLNDSVHSDDSGRNNHQIDNDDFGMDQGYQHKYNLVVNNLTIDYNDSYVVSLHDGSSPVKNKNVTLEVGNESLSNITDSKGNAYFHMDLKPGRYVANTSFMNISIKNNVSIEPIKDCGVKNKVYPISSDFEKTFLDSNGNPLRNADVQFKVNGLIYNRTTDSNGKAGVPLNLPVGKTEITIYHPDGEKITEEIDIVNPVIYEGTFV